MTHEFINLIEAYSSNAASGYRSVLATIVHVEGSSYRKEGTLMLISENMKMTGALSGGCVEKEVMRQSLSVFNTSIAKVMKYDGRFRLGCEGSIYILIECFEPEESLLEHIYLSIKKRESFHFNCHFVLEETNHLNMGTSYHFENEVFPHKTYQEGATTHFYRHELKPLNRLCIFGVERDASKLAELATYLGWEVVIIGHDQGNVGQDDFSISCNVLTCVPEEIDSDLFTCNTALVVMSHSFSKDLKFMLKVDLSNLLYIGLLGPEHRKERLLNELVEYGRFLENDILDKIHGPAGLNIGSQTPEEIALAIMAEITQVFKNVKETEASLTNTIKRMS